jgi:hypothetical protein
MAKAEVEFKKRKIEYIYSQDTGKKKLEIQNMKKKKKLEVFISSLKCPPSPSLKLHFFLLINSL